MRKVRKWVWLSVISVFLCGCSIDEKLQEGGSEITENRSSDDEGTVADNSKDESASSAQEELKSKETSDWTKLDCYTDKKVSIKNSNLLNYGYLTCDEAGNIYFVDRNTGGIYTGDGYGENKKLLSEDSGFDLQIEGDWLYYNSEEGGIKRIHIETGEVEQVYEVPCGEFILTGEKIYINAGEGFFVSELDGSKKEIIQSTAEYEMANFSVVNGLWLSNLVNGIDGNGFWDGYLLKYDEKTQETQLLEQRGMYPLLAGHMISVFDVNTNTRHVWNLKTEEDIDLDVYAQRIVSDGEAIYYLESHMPEYVLCRWTELGTEELLVTKAEYIEFTYLTEKVVYWLANATIDGKRVQQLWYYDLKTGETGQIY